MAKAAKAETAAQKTKRIESEKKQLAHWEKEKTKPKRKTYVWYILLVLALVQLVDEVATSIGSQMQSEIAIGLFSDRLSIMSLLGIISLPMVAFSVFYKTLSDRHGRKLFLIINTGGMGVGLFLVFLAGEIGEIGGIVTYIIAMCIINFFIPNDTQVLFITETAPKKKRSSLFAIIKAAAMLGVMLIPAMRRVLMGDDITRWNFVYVVPALLAIVMAVICLLTARESEVFLESRIAYLKMTDEERAERIRQESKETEAQGGIGSAFKFAFGHKQLRWLFISCFVFKLGGMGINYYQKIADTFYTTADVTSALMMYPISSALVTLINGIAADRVGRKKMVLAMASTSFLCFALFILGCRMHWNPYIIGLCIGGYTGAFWAAGDLMGGIMAGESAPTNLRASVLSAASAMNVIGGMLAMVVPMLALLITHDNYSVLSMLCLFGSIPAMGIALVLFSINVGDTTGIDLGKVRGDEWDKKIIARGKK